jgi:RNA polymerase sigma factor (sigma-70 family)
LEDIFVVNNEKLNFEDILAYDNQEKLSKIEDAKIIFDAVIDKLPPDEQVVIDMYYKQDMNQKEIAEALQLTQMAVNRKMKSAFNMIAALVAENAKKRRRRNAR